jgi:hypothetical protein
MRSSHVLAVALVGFAASTSARAVESCELNGQHVNPTQRQHDRGQDWAHALSRRRKAGR